MRSATFDMRKKETIGGTVTVEPLSNLDRYWRGAGKLLNWDCLFMLPPWICVWQSYFEGMPETQLYVVMQGRELLGLAPLTVSGTTAGLVSDSDLIDYSDFIIAPSREKDFFTVLLGYLKSDGINRLDLPRVRSDSGTISALRSGLPEHWEASLAPVDEFYEMDLPDTWESYLASLQTKERHETRRKLRRLESSGDFKSRVIADRKEVSGAMDDFIRLFRSNRKEKALFMSGDIEFFFRSMALVMAEAGILRLFFLDMDGMPVAGTMCFDYKSTFYLYNNGYDRHFGNLSVGLLSKVFTIRKGIETGRTKYNFLRGSETYKGRLGGRPVSLLRAEVSLK